MAKSTTFHFEINVNMSHCTYLQFELMEQIIEMDHRFGQQSQCREGKRFAPFNKQWKIVIEFVENLDHKLMKC